MMDLKEVGPNDVRSDEFDDLGRDISSQLKRFLMMDVEKDGEISPSKVAQNHVCAQVNGSYPVAQAQILFESAHSHGFGETVDTLTQNRRKIRRFRKTPYHRLESCAVRLLGKFAISEEQYNCTFRKATPSVTTSESNPTQPLAEGTTDGAESQVKLLTTVIVGTKCDDSGTSTFGSGIY